jgi:hypothetical protein
MNKIGLKVVFRSPEYPVFVVDRNKLLSAFDIDELARCCVSSNPLDGRTVVQVIDSTGEEFWYTPDVCILSPGFTFKKWTKKRIIETYNNSINAELSEKPYSLKSISSKKLERIIYDICTLLKP